MCLFSQRMWHTCAVVRMTQDCCSSGVSKAAESLSLLSDKLWTSLLTLPWSQTLSLANYKRKLLDLIQNQGALNEMSGSVMSVPSQTIRIQRFCTRDARQKCWSAHTTGKPSEAPSSLWMETCGRTCRNVISHIKSMLVFSSHYLMSSEQMSKWRDLPVPGWLHTSHSFIFKVTQRWSFAQPCHFQVVCLWSQVHLWCNDNDLP